MNCNSANSEVQDYEQFSPILKLGVLEKNPCVTITSESSFPFQAVLLRQLMSPGNDKTCLQSPSFLSFSWLMKLMEPWVPSVAALQRLHLWTDEGRHSHLLEISSIHNLGKFTFLKTFVHMFEFTSFRWTLFVHIEQSLSIWPVTAECFKTFND